MDPESEDQEGRSIDYGLPPDIVLATLPYLESQDIKNLSLTNRYFYKLLDYEQSNTLWHELYRKAYGYTYTNDEPFISKCTDGYNTCSERILVNKFPDLTWAERYKLRSENTSLYTWGSLQHARLGYTYNSNPAIGGHVSSTNRLRIRSGVNRPTPVPWFVDAKQSGSPSGEAQGREKDPNDEVSGRGDRIIVQISAGGFSFQLLTKSGKLFSTGMTYSGGHKGPGPVTGERDYNTFQEIASLIERNHTLQNTESLATVQVYDNTTGNMRIIPRPHQNIYQLFTELESQTEQFVTGNQQIRRMIPRDVFDFYKDNTDLSVDRNAFDKVKFVSVSSGRSHFLALDDKNEIYSWDSPEMNHGVRILFEGLPSRKTNPILKIGCGWDFNCVYIYGIGLVVWSSRSSLARGDLAAKANYKIIPDTADINGSNRILDFACCSENTVFYIPKEGDKLWLYSHELSKYVDLTLDGKIYKIEASYMTLALFTEQSTYTVTVSNGEVVHRSLTKINLAAGQKFITFSAGDYHNIALTDQGELYSWGLESDLCGCLGLGDAEEATEVQRVAVYETARSIRALQPVKVELPPDSICVAIAAGGWHSGALMLKKDA
ncbi:SCF ubiquitin ligase complex subunit SAF1 Ecym_6277 [Eremothecium cymbalariae DBVPG|uniref:F-box domain-containing protein n=1 Tax=Eremothecium cymbalariae (strain CBS 270.75 / DBVPG 7215 / KCTC 17166 / NRRL Y-17582) TaxID=931890 RepID=G8JVH8_ERECY|nr:hypothetical protein Ecym_6277 [Eremothecium cymbalariae DBVPG\